MGKVKTAAAILAAATGVAAHGHIPWIVVNGVAWQGYDVTTMPYMSSPPAVVGWATTNTDNGFVEPVNFDTADVICHRGGANAQGYVPVNAGDYITFLWTTWPESHLGPVIEYLAPCNGRCDTVDKTTLEFFKIAEAGLLDSGEWAAGILMANNNTWTTQIPSNIAPGNYVLRHEIIALHGASSANGAQDYPYCFNIQVSGSGTATPAGTPGMELMAEDDPGIIFNIWGNTDPYPIPGPALIAGGLSEPAPQGPYTATAYHTPMLYGSTGTTTVAPTTTQAPTTTAAPTTTLQTSTTSATSSASSGGTVPTYGQCGGIGYTGSTQCGSGDVCTKYSDYYSQCVPA